MQDLATHKTQALPPVARQVLETLLGRPLAEDEEISIWATRPHAAPTGEAREKAWRQLDKHLDRMAAKVQAPADEIEKVVDEVCDEVRHGPR